MTDANEDPEAEATRALLPLLAVPEHPDDDAVLHKAARRCGEAAEACDAMSTAGVVARRDVDASGTVTLSSDAPGPILWTDARAKGGMMSVEHRVPAPQGEDDAGAMRRVLMLRWPVRSGPEHFSPRTFADLAEMLRLGERICLSASRPDPSSYAPDFEKVLAGALSEPLSYNAPTPWCGPLLEDLDDLDADPSGFDAALLDAVDARMPPSVTPVIISAGDDLRVVVVPRVLDPRRMIRPDAMELLRAGAAVMAAPVLRDASRVLGRSRRA